MWNARIAALLAAAAFMAPGIARADSLENNLNTGWEVLWHQSGTATRLVRWEQDIKLRITGVGLPLHRERTVQAIRDVASVAGVRVMDVTDEPDATAQANLGIEIVADNALPDAQPCQTRLNFSTETRIDSVQMQMRNQDAARCVVHEAMHVMGVRGHPDGDTVLSYFTRQTERLSALDKAMLRAWYSPRTRGGMTPFELMPVLADELVAGTRDKVRAARVRDAFLARTVDQMRAFASGTGDVPIILKRCGKVSDDGVKLGRVEMSYFLGVAYQEGVSVGKDAAEAQRWLERAAAGGSGSARARLAAAASATVAGSKG